MGAKDFESPFVERESSEDAFGEAFDDRTGAPQRESPFAPERSFAGEAEPATGYESFEDSERGDQPEAEGPAFESEEIGIINNDDRRPVPSTTAVPFRWICHVHLKTWNGRLLEPGSGVMVSDRHVLTAGHVIRAAAVNPQQHTVEVKPAFDRGREPFDSWTAAKLRVAPGHVADPDNGDHDYGLITLNTRIGQKTFSAIGKAKLSHWGSAQFDGKHTIRPGDPNVLRRADVITAGYPGMLGGGKQMFTTRGRIVAVGDTMWTTVDATKGQSGSPLWIANGDRLEMVGIMTGAARNLTRARRTTDQMIRQIADWIIEDGDAPWMRESADESEQEAFQPGFENPSSRDEALEAETRYASSDRGRDPWAMEEPEAFESEAFEAEPPDAAREDEAEYRQPGRPVPSASDRDH